MYNKSNKKQDQDSLTETQIDSNDAQASFEYLTALFVTVEIAPSQNVHAVVDLENLVYLRTLSSYRTVLAYIIYGKTGQHTARKRIPYTKRQSKYP